MTVKTVVTGKNQVTIPAALARELKIEAGTELEWEIAEDKYLDCPACSDPRRNWQSICKESCDHIFAQVMILLLISSVSGLKKIWKRKIARYGDACSGYIGLAGARIW